MHHEKHIAIFARHFDTQTKTEQLKSNQTKRNEMKQNENRCHLVNTSMCEYFFFSFLVILIARNFNIDI